MEISKTSKRKIAYIITLPDLGGAQSHVFEVMSNIREYGYEPILITGKKGWLTEQAESKEIKYYIVSDLVRPIAPMHDIKAVKAVKRILQQEYPVLVHCHSSKAGIIGRIAAHSCNIPSIFTAHGWSFTEGVKPIKRRVYAFIENMVAYWTSKIICVSEYDRTLGVQYLSQHKEKMVSIHNCIPDIPQLVRDWERHPVGDVLNIIVVARFSQQKKNIQILYYLRKMLDRGLKINVTFVGEGPQLRQAKVEAQELKLEKEVIFLGARTDVAELLPNYDVFLLLSNWEGFPISIIEAMRAGIPVLASDVGGVPEAVNDGNGYIINKDEKNFLDIMQSLNDNKVVIKEKGKNARACFVENYTSEVMMRKIKEVYNQCI